MAGVRLTVDEKGLALIRERMSAFVAQGQDLRPAFRDIGELLLLSHDERWTRQESPDGTPWVPLSDNYAKRKKRNSDLILVLNRHLSRELVYDVSEQRFEFGTNYEYGAIHHFGGSPEMRPQNAAIPARPWLGASDEDLQEIANILADHLMTA